MNKDALEIKVQRSSRGKAVVSLSCPDGTSHTDKLDLADAKQRAKFITNATRGKKGITKAIRQELAAALEKEATVGKSEGGRPTQAEVLLRIALVAELFHTPGGHDSDPYATFGIGIHRETWRIGSNGFRRWLSRLYYEQTGKAPGSEALQEAINVLAGKAIFDGPEIPVAVRLAEHEGAFYLDLADSGWRAVEVTFEGWRVVTNPPVRFIRRRGLLPIPAPVPGGSVDELRPLVNLPDDTGWRLFVAWVLAALRPGRPFPILAVNGEQGSAKSTLCRMARALIDPNLAPLRRPPRDERDLAIAAANGWVVAYDNLSGIQPHLSDALCSLATGGGFATRELYTNDDEKLFDSMRPILINGIEEVTTRPDLLDRALTLTLPTIPDERRRDEEELWQVFETLRPRILGALLTAVTTGLRNKPTVRLSSKPRMADFATWIAAAEPALGWPAGSFLSTYADNREGANAAALEASVVAPLVLALVDAQGSWHGTVKQLLAQLKALADEKTSNDRDWPKGPRKLAGELRRLAPALRRAGINVVFHKRSRTGTPVTLERTGDARSQPSQRSPDGPIPGEDGERRERGERGEQVAPPCSTPVGDEVVEWTA
jgi:hypothetical protein